MVAKSADFHGRKQKVSKFPHRAPFFFFFFFFFFFLRDFIFKKTLFEKIQYLKTRLYKLYSAKLYSSLTHGDSMVKFLFFFTHCVLKERFLKCLHSC